MNLLNRRLSLGSDVTKYVLFLVGRVGSTFLTTLLQSHPDIYALSEELRDLEEQGADAQLSWSQRFFQPPLIGLHKARGFNVKLVHLVDRDRFTQLIQSEGCRILHMQRRNRVKAVISRINGKRLYNHTGMWGLFDEKDRLPPLTVDIEQFQDFLHHRESVDQELADYVRGLNLPVLELFYEDLLSDQQAFLDQLFSFLGVRPWQVEGSTLKITSDDLSKAITNFEDLKGQYRNTPYYEMFDEVSTA